MNETMKRDQYFLFSAQCQKMHGRIVAENDQEIRCVVEDRLDIMLTIPETTRGSQSWAMIAVAPDTSEFQSPAKYPMKVKMDQDLFSF